MISPLIAFLSTALAMLALDSIWLNLTADRLYRAKLGHLMLQEFNLAPAAIFYFIYVTGVTVLAVMPALADGKLSTALTRGAVLGLVAYATYDLTNQATLRGWSTTITVIDLCWGTFLTAFAASVGWWVTTQVAPRLG
ncbi:MULTISPECIES: DUF2177 family protein [unclassified Sphingomonas]|uniref:DUF2177 family protein n=1 Tax=unclassified Sphingomonas TaxID=196159 RepID=UPI000BD14BED|nr:MAG: hypothetical protein B7Z43_10715 [Sphingomonas sp. 12-62-6]OYX37971.1 MAG: hypothetical protein B7Y98_10295 [Sphingomonas sp. 32-62-10]